MNNDKNNNIENEVAPVNEDDQAEKTESRSRRTRTDGDKRRLRSGSYGIIFAVIAIVAVVVINLIVREIPSEYTMLDMTGFNVYAISDDTKKFLAGMNDDVVVYLVTNDSSRDEQLTEFLHRYLENTDHVTLVEVDPDEDPAFISAHGVTTMNSVVVQSAKRARTIDFYEIYEYSEEALTQYYTYYYYYGYDITETDLVPDVFDADNEITGAIDYVTTNDLPPVCFTTGHGETESSTQMTSTLEANSLLLSTVNLLSSGIPVDARVIVINNPSTDIADEELEALVDFIDGGGKVVLVTDAERYSPDSMKNITSLAAHCGLLPVDGIVLEGDAARHANERADVILSYFEDCILTADIENVTSSSAVLERAHGIVKDDSYDGTMLCNPVMKTTDTAYVIGKDDKLRDAGEDDVKGEFWLGAVSHEPDTDATFVWFASSDFNPASLYDLPSSSTNSVGLCMYSIVAVAGKPAVMMSVPSISTDANATLTIPQNSVQIWSAIIQFVIPVLVLVPGFILWLRRRLR